jgi:SNF2 family DNA or RNA helicase
VEIIDNKSLLLRLRDPKRVINHITSSKELPDNKVMVDWGLKESAILNALKINVPSPICGQYSWPGKTPFKHQIHTASFLTLHKKAFCFNEQGTGKTASAIWASDYLMNIGLVKRVLIICPLSIMDSAWREDLFTFAPHRSVSIAHGTAKKRKEILKSSTEFTIINYDGIAIVIDDLVKCDFDLVIVDEATHYKNAQTTRWKKLYKIIKESNPWLWLMTGTPASQSPVDAYGLAKLVNPSGVPSFFSTFKERVMFRVSQFTWKPREDAVEIVHKALQPAIRFTKDECLDLPKMIYVKRKVELTPQQNKYYKKLQDLMVMEVLGEEITAVNAAVHLNKLLQISAGGIYTDDGEAIGFDIDNRYKVLREVIDESSQKVLVFVPFKHAIQMVSQALNKDGIHAEIIDGSVPLTKRTNIFKHFQETEDPQVLVIQPQAAAHGITLTRANTVVWWGPTSSLETYAQANARIHRSGQTHKCTVVQLQGSDAEKHVYRLLDNRIHIHTKIIDLYKEILD